MSYRTLNYSLARSVIANCDKCSAHGESNVVRSPWGIFRMYKSSKRGRFYSLSGSKYFHNGGSYRIGSIRRLLSMFI